MDCLELSLKKLEDECLEWVEQLKKEYQPEMVIYVAKAGYLIGKVMSDVFEIPLIGISAVRKGNGLKNELRPIIKLIPNWLRYFIINLELKSNIHKKKSERNVSFMSDLSMYDCLLIKHIVIVDDSVDTGYSIKAVKEVVENQFPNAAVKVASLNVWDKSMEVINIDFALYRNTIIKAPMSKDSKEYDKFIELYNLSIK